jgi:hypothetical protein
MKIWQTFLAFAGFAVLVAPMSAGVLPACTGVGGNLVANCGFETGDFSSWSVTGNTGFTSVNSTFVDNGSYGAYLGPVGSDGILSQTITGNGTDTLYSVAFALTDGTGGTPNDFTVFWNGTDVGPSLLNFSLPAFGVVSGILSGNSGANTLEFHYRQDPAFWGLDDVTILPLTSGTPGNLAFANTGAVPEPGSLGLLLGGLGILGVTRRRRTK